MRKHLQAALLLAALVLAPAAAVKAASPVSENTVIESGIMALGQDLGGMTVSEAVSMIDGYYQNIANSSLTVTFDNMQAVTTPRALGLSWDASTRVWEAAGLGKSGSWITRYKDRQDLKYSNVIIDCSYTYDKNAV